MKAAVYRQYAPPEVVQVEELGKPSPQAGQVLVRVHATSINAGDYRGFESPIMMRVVGGGLLRPKNVGLGSDLAGTVEAVGENVSRFKPGDDVFGCATGAFGEYVLAREAHLVPKPYGVSFEEPAALPVAGLTALQAIRFAGGIQAGQKVLVQGASGGVGMFTVQLAKHYGGEVTAVCSMRNLEMVRSFGAGNVIDYCKEDFTRSGQRYDLIFAINGYHSLGDYKRALNPGGVYVCVGGTLRQIFEVMALGSLWSRGGEVKLSSMGIARVNQEDLETLKELSEKGVIKPVIDCSYPLSEITGALRYVIDQHAQGKVVVVMEGE